MKTKGLRASWLAANWRQAGKAAGQLSIHTLGEASTQSAFHRGDGSGIVPIVPKVGRNPPG